VNKNTKIYTGSPFLKDYIQSFANKQRVPLKRSPVYTKQNRAHRKSHCSPYDTTHWTLQQLCQQCKTLLHKPTLHTLCNMGTKLTITNHKSRVTFFYKKTDF